MASRKNPPIKFAICISPDENDMLTPLMIYQVLPDDMSEGIDYIRVIDDEGEDYLYPAANFILIDVSPGDKRALLDAFDSELPEND